VDSVDALHSLTLGDVLRENRRGHPRRTALVCGDTRLTYPEMDDRVNRLANGLLACGVAPGERILWLGQNCHRVLEGLLAAAKVGAVFCPVNWRQTAGELEFVIRDTDPSVVIWQQAEIGDAVTDARTASGSTALWLQHDAIGAGSYEDFVASGDALDPELAVDPASSVLQLYTAAFGGSPNGAQLSHTAVVVQDVMIGLLQDVSADYVYLNCGPLFHIATFMTTLATFHFGGTNVFTPRVHAEELCRLIQDERCTGAFLMPPTIGEMIEANKEGTYDLKTLRTWRGAPGWTDMITVDTSAWARRPAGYGQTEVMGMLTFNAFGGNAEGSSGRASPFAHVRIVDPDGNEVPNAETGEIVCRGLTMTNGYFGRDELNKQRLRGGWWHTNDLGRREADGSISFIAPKGRLVKSAAENIYPAEVEACIRRHPAVSDAAIIGVPDAKWTQSVKAIVVLKDGAAATAEDVIEHCRANIASYKKPRTVEFVDALPRQGFAVDYDALDERFGGGGYPGSG
jgi:long-chain acyl-CoA synthetase